MVQLSSPNVIPCRDLASDSTLAINSIHRGVHGGVLKPQETQKVLSLLSQVKTGEVRDSAVTRLEVVSVVGAFRSWRENLSSVGYCRPSNNPYHSTLASVEDMQTALKLLGFPGLADLRRGTNRAVYYAQLTASAFRLGTHSLADARTALVLKRTLGLIAGDIKHTNEKEAGLIITEGRVAASKVIELYKRSWWKN